MTNQPKELVELQPIFSRNSVSCTISPDQASTQTGRISELASLITSEQFSVDDIVLTYDYDENTAHMLLDFVLKEQQCCDFFDFTVHFDKTHNDLKLHVRSEKLGQTELKEVVSKMISR